MTEFISLTLWGEMKDWVFNSLIKNRFSTRPNFLKCNSTIRVVSGRKAANQRSVEAMKKFDEF